MISPRETQTPVAGWSRREAVFSALLFMIALLIFWRAFANGLSVGHDMETHFYRIAQLSANIREGEPFTQWSRYLMRGYGYPILMFYAPLFYWMVALIDIAIGNLSVAMRIVVLGELFLAGWGTYRLTRRYSTPAGAFLAGIGYMFSPYILYDATERGAFPELLGLALIPFVLASLDELFDRPTVFRYLRTVALLAITLLSHNVVPFFVFPLMGFFTAVRLLFETEDPWPIRLNKLWVSGLVVLFGLGLTSVYWLPALIELEYTLSRVGGSTLYDWPYYEVHFLSLADAITLPIEPIDPALANRPWVRTLSVGQVILSGLAAIFLIIRSHARRWTLWGWLIVGLASVYLLNSASKPVWVALNLPDFIQLPSRMLGSASLATAILAGYSFDQLQSIAQNRLKPSVMRWLTPAALILFAVVVTFSGWQWLYPLYSDVPSSPTPEEIITAMAWGDGTSKVLDWGGAASGETLPQWVEAFPPQDGLYGTEGSAADIQRLQLPETAELIAAESFPSGDQYTVELSEPATLTYQTFYFPGWRTWLNGEETEIEITDTLGLMAVELPAGTHNLEFRFGRTPLRTNLWWGVLGVVVLLGLSLRLPWLERPADEPAQAIDLGRIGHLALATVALLGLTLLMHRTDSFLRADRLLEDGRLTRVGTETNINFSQEFMHLGFSGPTTVTADQPFEVVQYWRPLRGIGVPYGFGLRVADDEGRVWSVSEVVRPTSFTGYPGRGGWRPEAYVRDAHILQLQPGIPPGEYWLEAEAFQRHVAFSLQPDKQVGVDPAQARIGKIVVTGGFDAEIDVLQVETEQSAALGASLELTGWSLREGIWRPGELGAIDLLWNSAERPSESLEGSIVLFNAAGEVVETHPFPIGGRYPMPEWGADQLVRDKLQWVLPASLPTGDLSVVLQVEGERVELGTIPAEAPERTFEPPSFAEPVGQSIEFAQLLGYDVVREGEVLRLTLHWEAIGETDTSYRVFVHFRNEDQVIRAQSDGAPAEWTRPTSGWLTGEFVSDRHTLFLPGDLEPGIYEFYVGLYNEKSGERLGELSLGEFAVE